ncbi:2Fe-2S iron-sulfur cluster-binding protein [Prescottella equi]
MSGTARSLWLRVADVVRETADAVSIVFEEGERPLDYRPGQYLTLRVPSERTGSVARCYSLASSPHRNEPPRVIVKRTLDGYASNWLCDNISGDDVLEVLPPAGVFTPSSLDASVILFGAGSGITPVLSIAKSVLTEGGGAVELFYANRDEASVIAAAELKELEAEFPDRLIVRHWLESVQGLPRLQVLAEIARAFPDWEAYACGPGPFMEAVRQAWAAAGRDRGALHLEVFTSLSGDPFEEPVIVEMEEGAETVPLEVSVDGEKHQLQWPKGTTLVDFLLARGIEVPYLCRDGECGTCLATCSSGDVTMTGNNLLDPEDVANGDVLTCQLVVTGDESVTVVF